MSRKITLELDETVRMMFLNYVSVSVGDGMVMACKEIDTNDILTAYETGKPIVISKPEVKQEEI